MLTSKDFFFLFVRIFLGFIFFTSGFCKLTDGHFAQLIGPPNLIKDLAKYQLENFGYFIAISQVIFGMLVLTQRFSLLGLIALVPMNASILGVTISQSWAGTPFINGVLLLLNILCLIYDKDIFNLLFKTYPKPAKSVAAVKFPDIKIPLIMVIFTAVSIIIAKESDLVLRILTTSVLILSGINILRQVNLNLFQKITVYISMIFYTMFVNLLQLKNISESFEMLTLGVVVLGIFTFILSFIFRKTRVKELSLEN